MIFDLLLRISLVSYEFNRPVYYYQMLNKLGNLLELKSGQFIQCKFLYIKVKYMLRVYIVQVKQFQCLA
jgi:hypothetical protein